MAKDREFKVTVTEKGNFQLVCYNVGKIYDFGKLDVITTCNILIGDIAESTGQSEVEFLKKMLKVAEEESEG